MNSQDKCKALFNRQKQHYSVWILLCKNSMQIKTFLRQNNIVYMHYKLIKSETDQILFMYSF